MELSGEFDKPCLSWRFAALVRRRDLLKLHVAECNRHRRPHVYLNAQQASEPPPLDVIIHGKAHHSAVDDVDHDIAPHNEMDGIPIVGIQ